MAAKSGPQLDHAPIALESRYAFQAWPDLDGSPRDAARSGANVEERLRPQVRSPQPNLVEHGANCGVGRRETIGSVRQRVEVAPQK
jgi:hypothetical protein